MKRISADFDGGGVTPKKPPGSNCVICLDTGWVKRGVLLTPCSECKTGALVQAEIDQRRWQAMQLPTRYRNAKLQDFAQLPVAQKKGKLLALYTAKHLADGILDAGVNGFSGASMSTVSQVIVKAFKGKVPQYISDMAGDDTLPKRTGIVLYGGVGVGKTYMASAMLNQLSAQGIQCHYARLRDMLTAFTDTWGQRGVTESDVLDYYGTVPVLLMDDMNIGVSGVTSDRHADYVASIIRHRNANQVVTIGTCNVDQAGFEDMWGTVAATVLNESCYWIAMGGEKIRDERQPAVRDGEAF